MHIGPGLRIPQRRLPAAGPLIFDFTAGSLPAGATLSRASTGTYFNASGVLSSAAIDAGRFDYSYNGSVWSLAGLLVESQTITFARQTADVSSAYGAGSAMAAHVANSTVAPDGNTTADTICPTAANTNHGFFNSTWSQSNGLLAAGQIMTNAIFAKALSGRYLVLAVGDQGGASVTVCFDLQTGSMVDDGGSYISRGCVDVGNGWRRCWVSKTITAASPGYFDRNMGVRLNASASFFSNTAGTETVAVWGWDWARGGQAPSHIPATTANVTRSADVLTLDIDDGNYDLEVVTPNGTFTGSKTVSGGAGYAFAWSDLTGAATERHVRSITAAAA